MTEAERLGRAWIEVWGRDDPATLPLAEDFVHESPFGRIEGRARYLEVIAKMVPLDMPPIPVVDVVASEDRACIEYRMGDMAACDWVTVADGKITAVRGYYDSRDIPGFQPYA